MTDESRTPEPEQSHAPDAAPPPEAGGAQPGAGVAPEQTGIIDLDDTRAIPAGATRPIGSAAPADTPAPAAAPVAPAAPGASPGSAASAAARRSDEERDEAWFDVFGGEHPVDGAGVPARADAAWGSDRADALAEQAHRATYAPPVDPALAAPAAAHAAPSGTAGANATAVPAYANAVPGDLEGLSGDGADGPPGGVPLRDEPAGRRRQRGPLVLAVVGLCLLSGVIGGVAGQLAEDRINTGVSTLPPPGPGSTQRPAGSVASIAANALPSVVTIKVDAGSEGSATGSGFVVDGKGHVLTNNHVVAPGVSGDIEVVLSNGDTEKATIVGRDESYDLAVLKIDRTDLTPLQLGPSDQVVVGDQVIAVGAPLGLDQTVTTGIVSALNRPVSPGEPGESSYINAIQTDAAINPGNSGGPLLDMAGKVIGVNSAIARVPGTSGSTGGSIGLGFAIPSDQARRTADQLIATGKASHPVIGVGLDRTFSGEGARVVDKPDAVTAGGPAAKAGVKPGDVIVGFEGKRIRTADQLIVSIRARAIGDTVTLTVERGGQDVDLKMTLEADPPK